MSDATKLSTAKRPESFMAEMANCSEKNLMMLPHMEAISMKVPNPIVVGHCVKAYFMEVFAKHGDVLDQLKIHVNNGLGDLYDKIAGHPQGWRDPDRH